MTKIITILAVICSVLLSAQQLDTLSIGTGYTQQVWYNLETGNKTRASGATWDIAFSMRPRVDGSIWVNPNATLYKAIAPASAWATVTIDTLTLTPQYGVDSTWSMGAFNRTGDNSLNYGWGNYSPVTHNIVGDSIYVVKNLAGKWQKILIERLALDTSFFFKYADLNGANEKAVELKKANYKDRLMGYYSLVTHAALDREPAIKTWDLTAFRYYGLTPDNTGSFQSYPLTGILQSPNVTVAKVIKRDTASDSQSGLTYNSRINTIGSDWKAFDLTAGWKVADSTAYFIKAQNGKIYKLIFTRFGGTTTGNMIFTKELILTSSIKDETGNIGTFAVYPNPAKSDNMTLIYDINVPNQSVDFQLISITGQVVFSQKRLNTEGGLVQQILPSLNVSSGLYLARLTWGGKSIVQKVMIKD
jgi:hypothetical protein